MSNADADETYDEEKTNSLLNAQGNNDDNSTDTEQVRQISEEYVNNVVELAVRRRLEEERRKDEEETGIRIN